MKSIPTAILLILSSYSFAQTGQEYFLQFEDKIEKEDFRGALKAIDKAIEAEPDSFYYQQNKAYLIYSLGKPAQAVEIYDNIIKLEPSMDAYNGRGICYESMMMFDYAVNDYLRAAEIAPTDTAKYSMYVNIGSAKSRNREFDAAYEYLMKAYNFDSTNTAVLNNLGTVCDEVGRGDETLKYLKKVVELEPDFIAGWVNVGFKLQMDEKYEESLSYFDKAVELDPTEALAWNNRGYTKMKLGDLKGAMKDIDKSLELYSFNSYAHRNKALVYIAMGKSKKACEELDKAIEKGFVKMYGQEVLELKAKNCK